MSKQASFLRYNAIYKRVKRSPASLEEVKEYLEKESEISGYDLEISSRTFQRDLADIRLILGVDIQFDPSRRKYVLQEFENEGFNKRLLEAFETYNALKESTGYSEYLDFEKRGSLGMESFHGLLHAIKNRLQLNFNYQSFWDNEPSLKKTNPFSLKEFKSRWYLIALDLNSEIIKTYALDRILDIEITKKKYSLPPHSDLKAKFDYSYGIIGSVDGSVPERVVLSFEPYQGRYVKSLPLHHSQKTIIENENEFKVELMIYVAYDFVKELLSYGTGVKVIEPESLVLKIKEAHHKAFQQYNNVIQDR